MKSMKEVIPNYKKVFTSPLIRMKVIPFDILLIEGNTLETKILSNFNIDILVEPKIVLNHDKENSNHYSLELSNMIKKLIKLGHPLTNCHIYFYKILNRIFLKCGVYPFSYPIRV